MNWHATHSLLGWNTCQRSLAFTRDTNTPVYIRILNKTAQQGEWVVPGKNTGVCHKVCDKTWPSPAGTQQCLNQLAKYFPFLTVKRTFFLKGVKRILPSCTFSNPITISYMFSILHFVFFTMQIFTGLDQSAGK